MCPRWSAAILSASLSTQTTVHAEVGGGGPVTNPTYPVPTMQMFMTISRCGPRPSTVDGSFRYHSTDRRQPLLSGTRARKPRAVRPSPSPRRSPGRRPADPAGDRTRPSRRSRPRSRRRARSRVTGCAPPRFTISKPRSGPSAVSSAVDDVVDVGVVAARAAVAVEGDGLARSSARTNLSIAISGRCRGP